MDIEQVFANTDWAMLAKQKEALLHHIMEPDSDPLLEGLLQWVDSLQDAAELAGYPVVWLSAEEA